MPRREIVGEHYVWLAETSEIECRCNGLRRPESDYSVKVDVYEDRVRHWFLNVASEQVATEPSVGDYVALSIALAYIEGVEHFRRGEEPEPRQAGEWFRLSFTRIFPSVPELLAGRVWKAVRCGLFHSGFTHGPTLLSRDRPDPVVEESGFLYINPHAFVRAVDADFTSYLAELRADPQGEQAVRFVRLWDRRWEETEVRRQP